MRSVKKIEKEIAERFSVAERVASIKESMKKDSYEAAYARGAADELKKLLNLIQKASRKG